MDDVTMEDANADNPDNCDMAIDELDESKIPELPTEILGMIMSFLPHDGLKSARLVNKEMKRFAQPSLFGTINLKVNIESFMKFENITLHEDLKGLVKQVFYDGRLLPWDFEDFSEYVRDGIGSGLDLRTPNGGHFNPEILDHYFTELELHFHHRQYCRYIHGQKYLHRDSNEVNLLTNAFSRLPHLTKIEFDSGGYHICEILMLHKKSSENWRQRNAKAVHGLSYISQKTLIAPRIGGEDFFQINRLRALMTAAHSAQLEITHLSAGTLLPEQIERKMTNPTSIFEHLVSLQLAIENYPEDSLPDAIHILGNVPKLERLCLSTPGNIDDFGLNYDIFELLDSNLHYPHLRHLSLRHLRVGKPPDFNLFLGSHAKTLRSLMLSDISIDGSFVELAMFLSKSMTLDQVDFQNLIGNRFNELWHFNDTKRGDKRCAAAIGNIECCLKHRVEQYVLGVGTCPFERGVGGERRLQIDDEEFVDLAWRADEDDSLYTDIPELERWTELYDF